METMWPYEGKDNIKRGIRIKQPARCTKYPKFILS